MTYELRPKQQRAVDSLVNNWSFVRMPTATGKSFVVAGIATKYQKLGIEKIIVLQPNAEILEQNYEKYNLYANQFNLAKASKFSASVNEKSLEGDVIFATIGSINNDDVIEEFEKRNLINSKILIVNDECHLVGTKTQHTEFAKRLGDGKGLKVFGLTATPYRLTDGGNEFITTSNDSPFKEMTYCYQIAEAIEDGVWCPVEFVRRTNTDFNVNNIYKKGKEVNDDEMHKHNVKFGNYGRAVSDLKQVCHEPCLVFLPTIASVQDFIKECSASGIKVYAIDGNTPMKERRQILSDFTSGKINVVANVGTMTCGFDYPNLRNIFCLRFTYSLSLIEQIIGRGVRVAPNKKFCRFFDYVGIYEHYGDLTKLLITGTNANEKAVCTPMGFIIPPNLEQFKELTSYVNNKKNNAFSGSILQNFQTLSSALKSNQAELQISSQGKVWHQESDSFCHSYFERMKHSPFLRQNNVLYEYLQRRSWKHKSAINLRKYIIQKQKRG